MVHAGQKKERQRTVRRVTGPNEDSETPSGPREKNTLGRKGMGGDHYALVLEQNDTGEVDQHPLGSFFL